LKVIVGLGNPGKKYLKTKHNFGFWIIDSFLKNCSLKLKPGKGDYHYEKTDNYYLVKPMSYMNNSGTALAQFISYFKIGLDKILIVYDDIDLPLGLIKYKKKGGSGGHRGIESIIYHLNDDNFHRLRIGIATNEIMRPSEKYVLSPFHKSYGIDVDNVIKKSYNSITCYLADGIDKAMNKFNNK
jgi:PTH1 family peptidyl-tRNA hydrolase